MTVKVRVTTIKSLYSKERRVVEGIMNQIPRVGKTFTVIANPELKGGSYRLKVIESLVVKRIFCIFPDQVWIQTEASLYKIEVLSDKHENSSRFLRWIPFFKTH